MVAQAHVGVIVNHAVYAGVHLVRVGAMVRARVRVRVRVRVKGEGEGQGEGEG